ncbi:hypothetical protein ACFSUS_04680 [Spirosoma soli]|uniref:Lipocalin-like domain-containing protein n=1 Tax=Spirosoma soli TaxID=1770529 RepID=A0ABW5M2R2_9BACT
MKKGLLFVFAVLVFAACKKDNDPAPADLATAIAGNYALNSFFSVTEGDSINFPTLPTTIQGTTISGTISATKRTSNFVDLLLTVKELGTLPLDSVEVRQSGNTYELYLYDLSLGTVEGNTMNFNVSDIDPDTNEPFIIRFQAKK